MSTDAMEVDPPDGHTMQQKAETLHRLATGQLSSSLSKLLGSSQDISTDKDFHFYHKFNDFKVPIQEIAEKSKIMLDTIGSSSSRLWDKEMAFPEDLNEAYGWLVNMNDHVFERFDASTDEFQRLGENGVREMELVDSDNDFQMLSGMNNKEEEEEGHGQVVDTEVREENLSPPAVKLVSKDTKCTLIKAKVPFHIPSIPKPQDEYKIVVNNSNKPFDHVWLQKGDGGLTFMHPQKKFSFEDFVDKDIEHVQPVKSPPIEDTPFKLVEDVKDLKLLAAKLRIANEFAVDLEHNNYRSFQGLTCLMQVSTRTEDFVVDTLKLRIHIGPYLREVFKDPTKKKIFHGANNDILWLQRDFGIYVCNMFDTGQASRVLELKKCSLEYLLSHLCGVAANKEYQNSDWRLRPLLPEMIKYAREDTHYLLYIYDLLRIRLHSTASETSLLAEVYRRSYDLCMQLYEKELLTDTSYLNVHGLQNADLNAQRLSVAAGLYQWRDGIARTEDESTGYILPNKTLLELAKNPPFTPFNLMRVITFKHPFVEKNISVVISIIRRAYQNYSSFEAAALQLREKRLATEAARNATRDSLFESPPAELSPTESDFSRLESLLYDPPETRSSSSSFTTISGVRISEPPGGNGFKRESLAVAGEVGGSSMSGAVVQAQKMPISALGGVVGSFSTKREFILDKKLEKEEIKMEQIKSPMNIDQLQPSDELEPVEEPQPTTPKASEIICLDSDSDIEEPEADEDLEEHGKAHSLKIDIICLDSDSDIDEPELEMVNGGEQIEMLSALSTSLQDCLNKSTTHIGNP
ncbi:protein RRP6-like 2 [Impatiens glandulifera]|uniref:protein RRP6-like 2 n=1 Tax=Impatiens glandulifera TaxID=253017 RepID=UPI001FB09415|nr:protein RRP6-like 2 [Impatiens glandulifera]